MGGVVILGGGLTGLSCARHLAAAGIGAPVHEKEARAGGLAVSDRVEGFVFDHAGHLLHLRTDYGKALVAKLFPEEPFREIERSARIFSKGVFTEYPFQANLHGLPPEVVRECLLGFVEAAARDEERQPDDSFAAWCRKTFGEGIYDHFLRPFNEKMWRMELEELGTEWVSWSVPRPSLEEVVDGALGIQKSTFGYNPSFLYPKEGGIEILANRLAEGVEVATGSEAVEVHLGERCVRFADGTKESWDRLVNTTPLPRFLSLCADLPEEQRRLAEGLRWVDVHVFNVGVRGPAPVRAHWVYVPEAELPFYRYGVATNFAPSQAPEGHHSLYVEVSRRPDEPVEPEALQAEVLEGLRRAGALPDPGAVVLVHPQRLRPAYVVHDAHRRRALPALLDFLAKRGVLSVGRYGAWIYSSMEDAVLHGREAAETEAGRPVSLLET